MAINTTRFQVPFYRVRVGARDKNGKLTIYSLPDSVARAIVSFQYHEVMDGGEEAVSRITLSIAESALVGKDYPGRLLDLMMPVTSQTSFKTKDETTLTKNKADSKNLEEIYGPLTEEDYKSKQLLEEERKILSKQEQAKNIIPQYFFQERNIIEVTWGYRHPYLATESGVRVARGVIQRLVYKAAASIPTLEVFAVDIGQGEFSKLSPSKGISFTISTIHQVLRNQKGNFRMSEYAANKIGTSERDLQLPARVDDIARVLALKVGAKDIIIELSEEEISKDVIEDNSVRSWSTSTNLHSLFRSFAEKIGAHYRVEMDTGGQPIIYLTSRKNSENQPQMVFGWKGAGSKYDYVYNTIKDFTLSMFPENGDGAASTGIDPSEKEMTGSTDRYQAEVTSDGIKAKVPIMSTFKIVDQDTGQVTEYGAESNSKSHSSKTSIAAERLQRSIRLDFTSIGIPNLKPFTIRVLGIGVRYSGLFHIISVTHKIDDRGGYVCNVMANSGTVNSGGVEVDGNKAKEIPSHVKLKVVREDGTSKKNILDTAEETSR